MVLNKKTNGWLVMDIGDRVNGTDESYMVTTAPNCPGPCTRSIFVLKRVDETDIFGSDAVIKYGQKVRFEANSYLFRKPLWLNS